jgi:hypothetical protein
MFHEYIGSTETLFDDGGLANRDNFLFDDITEFEKLDVQEISKEEFENKVALPFKLGFLTDNSNISFSREPERDLVIAQDNYDNVCYFFMKKKEG